MIDLQINGAFGVDFNADGLQVDDFASVDQRLRAGGTTAYLATIITDHLPAMTRRIRAIADWLEATPARDRACIGIHAEGPFISQMPGYVGAHPPAAVRPADVESAGVLLDASRGHLRVLTLAPERDDEANTTRWLTERGIVVAAGHTDASRDQILAAVDAGLGLLTHFGNACPAAVPRHDNVLWRMVSAARGVCLSVIPDGHHVPTWWLGLLIDLWGIEKVIAVSDAISAAGLGPGEFKLGGRVARVDDRGATWDASGGHLVGAATLLPEAMSARVTAGDLSADEARMLSDENPRRLLGLS